MPNIQYGMRIDVIMKDEQVRMSGYVDDFNGIMLFLTDPEGTAAPVPFGTELKLKCYETEEQFKTYHAVAVSCRNSTWKITEVCEWYGWERRGFYRQTLSEEARVLRTYRAMPQIMQQIDIPVACRVLDISGSGLLMACSQATFEVGDRLCVMDVFLFEDEPAYTVLCEIMRIEQARTNYMYGCRFLDLGEKEEDRLVHAIFRLQQQDRREREKNKQ